MFLIQPPASAATATVVVQNMAFSPSVVTLSIGGTVAFSFRDSVSHTTMSDQGFWNSGSRASGQTYTLAFPSAGVFAYHCSIHPMMTGVVTARLLLTPTPSGYLVVWSTAPGGPHRVFDVQWRRANSTTWVTMARRTTAKQAIFGMSMHGSFVVRARSDNPTTGLNSGWTGRGFSQ